MQKYLGFQCSLCGSTYSPDEVTYVCPKDSGNLDVIIDTAAIRKIYGSAGFPKTGEASLWRYLAAATGRRSRWLGYTAAGSGMHPSFLTCRNKE